MSRFKVEIEHVFHETFTFDVETASEAEAIARRRLREIILVVGEEGDLLAEDFDVLDVAEV